MKKTRTGKLAFAVALYLATACPIPAAEAMTASPVGYDGRSLFEIYYYGAEDADNFAAKSFFKSFSREPGIEPLVYTLQDDIKARLDSAFMQWAEILGPGAKNKNPVQYFVGTNNRENASASSVSATYGVQTENPNHLHDALQNGADIEWIESLDSLMDESAPPPAAHGFGGIIIGQNLGINENDGRYGFVAPLSPKPVATEMSGCPIIPVMFHEIGHSLGVLASPKPNSDYGLYQFGDAAENANSFTSHLYDQNGRRADHAGLWVMTSQTYEAIMNSDRPDVIAAVKGNAFIVDTVNSFSGRNGRAYLTFRGDHVTEALGGRTFADPKGNQISGLPINMWEGENPSPEFSHIDLERSVMSHQNYRSYNTFMEAELALLQDIGYNIDRKNFYGRSIYNNGQTLTNTQGFSARNAEGTAYVDGYNTSTYGVGLHIYGSNNNITQAGNIYTKGNAAAGIRVDGVNNTVTVAKGTEIHSDGTFGAGVLAAYGKNHTIHIDGSVTAKGDGGVGVWADFGANSLGATSEYRGSYIRYYRILTNGSISRELNLGLNTIGHAADDFSFSDLANGDLDDKMATINVTGTIEAADNAIYIGVGSFVDNINLNEGAKLKGNITNCWKKFSEDMGIGYSDTVEAETLPFGVTIYKGGLMLQYKGQFIPYTKYVPDLVTKLNFNADMSYDDNIQGDSNTKMNVNNGTLLYTGNANVVNVTVAKNAALYGGNYTVNDMTGAMAGGFSDDTTGQLRNHGTIGAADKDSSLTIQGSEGNNAMLISDGRLVAVGGGSKGNIEVAGSANLEGSTVRAFRYLPDETGTVVTATGGITGNVGAEVLGMMNTEIKLTDGNNLTLATAEANNLGNATDEQNEIFNAMSAMRKKLQSEGDTARLDEMRALYSMDPATAKSTLSDIGSSDAADMAAIVQQSSVSSQIIDDRLSTAFAQKTVQLSVPASNLVDTQDENAMTLKLPVKLPVEAENDIWVKFTKNWGDMKSGANYHANAISGGYDKAINKNWRLGGYISYNEMSLGNKNSGGSAYDTRAGVYALYHKNASDAYIYANAGWIRNKHYRGLPALGLSGEGKNGGHIYELGGEYKQDLNNGKKIWGVSPYINFQLSHLRQGGYGENGLGIYNHQVNSLSNTYFAGGLGLEFKRKANIGSYGVRIGVKHAFSGADPNLAYGFEGDASNRYSLRGQQDKTHLVLRLFGETEFAPGWQIAGDTLWQKGAHDKNLSASVMFRRVW